MIFSEQNRFRILLKGIITHKLFEMTIFATVICSAIFMMLE